MPTYDYKCKQCDTVTTLAHSINDTTQHCQDCDHELTRIYTAPSIVFKGNGWAKNER